MIYSTPTVADLDGDGRFEIIVGTSLGLLYLLDGESGFVRRYFPMQFNAIEVREVKSCVAVLLLLLLLLLLVQFGNKLKTS